MRDGNRSNSVETPVVIAEGLALGLEEVHRIVADRKAFKAFVIRALRERHEVHRIVADRKAFKALHSIGYSTAPKITQILLRVYGMSAPAVRIFI